MALFRNFALECRHLTLGDIRTSIALERSFWQAAERQAAAEGIEWREWTQARLKRRPGNIGRGRWLRVSILEGLEGPQGPQGNPKGRARLRQGFAKG